jgi:hypothetical protein
MKAAEVIAIWGSSSAPISTKVRTGNMNRVKLIIVFAPKNIVFVHKPVR